MRQDVNLNLNKCSVKVCENAIRLAFLTYKVLLLIRFKEKDSVIQIFNIFIIFDYNKASE